MKRSAELRDLSEEHHYGLVAARSLRLAAANPASIAEAIDVFLLEWNDQIQPHFRCEEAVLLPQSAEAAGSIGTLIDRTLAEHAELRLAVNRMMETDGEARRPLAAAVARLLHDHIRFEERVLFPAIEEALAGNELRRLGEGLSRWAEAYGRADVSCRTSSRLPTD